MEQREYANGEAFSHKGMTILFPWGGTPQYLFGGDTPTHIASPKRFGTWETTEERKAYTLAFATGTVVTMAGGANNVCYWFGTLAECRDKPCRCLDKILDSRIETG